MSIMSIGAVDASKSLVKTSSKTVKNLAQAAMVDVERLAGTERKVLPKALETDTLALKGETKQAKTIKGDCTESYVSGCSDYS